MIPDRVLDVWIFSDQQFSWECGMKSLIHSKTPMVPPLMFGNCKQFHPTLNWACAYLSMLGSKLTLNVRGPSYLGLTRSISWLLKLWLLTSPGHQKPWYWLCRISLDRQPDASIATDFTKHYNENYVELNDITIELSQFMTDCTCQTVHFSVWHLQISTPVMISQEFWQL